MHPMFRPCPLPLKGDGYTVSGECLASPKARQRSVYNLTNRKSAREAFPGVAQDSRMVLYGVSDFVHRYLTTPITHDDIDESLAFMETANAITGRSLYFPERTWRRVVRLHGGYLPIRIEALPEGSTFYPFEPYVQVTAGDEYGELAAQIEMLLAGMIGICTARVTLERHLLERMTEFVMRDRPDASLDAATEMARDLIIDFGGRATIIDDEAELAGRCHLICFNGTDTFNAAYRARKMGAPPPVGTSILALAHRIVQGWDEEAQAYQRLAYCAPEGASYVADCYNYKHAVENYLLPIAKGGKLVLARPDSGNAIDQIDWTVSTAMSHGLFRDQGGRTFGTDLQVIYGDSVKWETITRLYDHLRKVSHAPTGWLRFGIGGWLRNTPNRDSLSTAYKLAARGDELEPVVKLSEVAGKLSVPGPTLFHHNHPRIRIGCNGMETQFRTYYNNGGVNDPPNFMAIRDRATHSFRNDKHLKLPPDYGMNGETLGEDVKAVQYAYREKHRHG